MQPARRIQDHFIVGTRAEPGRERTAGRGLWLALALAACAGPRSAPPLPDATPLRSGELRVRLAFGEEADLDLYVTGPGQETVYFANTPVGGAELDADRRCEHAAPRIETVSVRGAPAGRYRVGIDFPERCAPGARAPYRLVVEAAGHREERSGWLHHGRFEPRVLEFDLEP